MFFFFSSSSFFFFKMTTLPTITCVHDANDDYSDDNNNNNSNNNNHGSDCRDEEEEHKEEAANLVENTLAEVLSDSHFLDLFEDHCDRLLCGENIRFWRALTEFKRDIKELIATFGDTHKDLELQLLNHPINKKVILDCLQRHLEELFVSYFKPLAVNELNLDEELKQKTILSIERILESEFFLHQQQVAATTNSKASLLTIENLLSYLHLFDEVEWSIKDLIANNSFQSFTQTEVYRRFRANKDKQTLLKKLAMMPSFYVAKSRYKNNTPPSPTLNVFRSSSIPTLSTTPPPFLHRKMSPRAFSSVPNIIFSSSTSVDARVCSSSSSPPAMQKTRSVNELLSVKRDNAYLNNESPGTGSPRKIQQQQQQHKQKKKTRSSSFTGMIQVAASSIEKRLQQKENIKREKSDSASLLSLLQSPSFPEFNLKHTEEHDALIEKLQNVELDRQKLRKELIELKLERDRLLAENRKLLSTVISCTCSKRKEAEAEAVQSCLEVESTIEKEQEVEEEEDDQYDEDSKTDHEEENGTIYAGSKQISVFTLLSHEGHKSIT
eukprot:TRINITY_DN4669_c0_g4_i1.p1 TRINITY_DN4669_c0_g4~~TRINITY_DN4669_c0_g4_i1.p1  ORF type:complete len:552 (+),score=153.57 TRINITY_DN4669_c0_g4_i1:1581-3236(+)